MPVLPDASDQIVGLTNVQSAILLTGKDIDIKGHKEHYTNIVRKVYDFMKPVLSDGMKLLRIILLLIFVPYMLQATAEDVSLDNAEQEARAQALMRELRCVACENEPVSQSAAPIAEDMRARVRVMIEEGASDEEVRGWFEGRYGEFVLFRPKTDGVSGWLLWGLPFVLLLSGGIIGARIAMTRRDAAEAVQPEDV